MFTQQNIKEINNGGDKNEWKSIWEIGNYAYYKPSLFCINKR